MLTKKRVGPQSRGEVEQEKQYVTTAQNTLSQTLDRFSREVLNPNTIEQAAIAVAEAVRLISIHPSGSIGGSCPSTDDGSCKGRTIPTRTWHPLHPETRVDQRRVLPEGVTRVQHLPIHTAVDYDHPIALGVASPYQDTSPLRQVSTLIPVKRPGISIIQKPDEWVEIEITVDSGACVTVMPRTLCQGISILQNRLSLDGVEYEVANGAHIPNLGERRCEMMTVGSDKSKRITFQVADVHKPLLSISGCADMGFDCFLGEKGGHLRDRESGETIPLERRDNLYIMRAWIRQDPTVSVSQPFVGPG